MRRILLVGFAALSLSGVAFAQSGTSITTGAGARIVVKPEQQTKIKSYMVEHHTKPVTMKERVIVGGTLPTDVELVAVPSDWGREFNDYEYVYSNSQVIFVEPKTRRVIEIID